MQATRKEQKEVKVTMEQINWSTGKSVRMSKRNELLCDLFLQVHDSAGRLVHHTKRQWLELEAEFSRLNAQAHVEFCARQRR